MYHDVVFKNRKIQTRQFKTEIGLKGINHKERTGSIQDAWFILSDI